MDHLSATQLRQAFGVLGELAELRDLADFPPRTAQLLRQLIPCDISSYNAVDPQTRRVSVAADPADCLFEGGADAFACYVHQNPLVAHFARTGDGRARCFSDFLTRRQLHATDLYHYVYKHIGVEHQLAVTLPSPIRRAEMIGFTLSRERRDFSVAERELLDLLSPHLRATLDRLTDRALAEAMLAGAGEDEACWTVLVESDGVVVCATAPAERADGLAAGAMLPWQLRAWLAGERRTSELVIDGRRVRVRVLTGAYLGLDALQLTPVGRTPGVDTLIALGLTRRQAEILACAARGWSSKKIALELGLSRRTIEKHFEAIYARLGVGTRAEAIVRALSDGATLHSWSQDAQVIS